MTAPIPEFSRLVPVARLGAEPFRQDIEATESERAALARRFDLVALDRLAATVELVRRGDEAILLSADYQADFAQSCVVTLDPVPGSISDTFQLLYGPPELASDDPEEAALEPLASDWIDIGEAVAQEFSLALPPFPRRPGANVEAPAEPQHPRGPFDKLARLLDPKGT